MSLVLAAVIVLFVYQPVRVEGTSMMPVLVDSERVFINRFLYRTGLGQVQRGDLVVFQSPQDPAKNYIKRIIGTPGDTVELRGGLVWLNGREIQEPYVPEEYRDQSSFGPVRVPATIAAPPTTAACGGPWRVARSTGKRCSPTGRWSGWGRSGRRGGQRAAVAVAYRENTVRAR
jgi:signal peptidase I